MSQRTLDIDPETHAIVERAARARGLSKSCWLAEAVRAHAANEWPTSCVELAGRFGDFPLHVDTAPGSADVPRVGF